MISSEIQQKMNTPIHVGGLFQGQIRRFSRFFTSIYLSDDVPLGTISMLIRVY